MLRVERFDPSQLGLLNQWLRKHGCEEALARDLPLFGYMAYHYDEPIAAGFLRQAEGGLGIFDSLVTNPDHGPKARHKAIEALVSQILATARELMMTRIIAFTRHPSILERANSHGFERQAHVVTSLKL